MKGRSSIGARGVFFSFLVSVGLLVIPGLATKAATFNVLSRTILTEYRILGRSRVPILIAADPVRTAEVVRAIELKGGEIVSRQDDIGYLYVRVKVDTAEALEKIPGIDAMEVAGQPSRGWTELQANDGPTELKKTAPPTPFLSVDNPYTAEYATQASQFKFAHPTFDGRGVVIGIPEAADPSLPSMKGALDLRGIPVPKFPIYWWGQPGRARPANAELRANFWQQTEQVTPDGTGKVTFAGRTFTLPAGIDARDWRICARGLSPDQGPGGSGEIVLWAVDKRQLWILLEGKTTFHDAPTAKVDQFLPFVAIRDDDQKREENNRYRAWIFVVDETTRTLAYGRTAGHGQMVASILGGKGFLGSDAGGIAPAVQIAAFVETGAREDDPVGMWDPLESVLKAMKDPGVNIAQNAVLITSTGKGLDTRVAALLLDRAILLTQKPAAVSVGNTGPALTGIFGLSLTYEGFSIGGYTPRETWLANLGFEPSSEVTPPAYSSWGPTSDGSLKPDFLSLTTTLCERIGSATTAFEKPYGIYTVSGGTSGASPHAAGHLALLISGAKQKGLKYDWRRLRSAISTTAKFLPGVEARVQGHGLIQVADAWQALNKADSWDPPVITSAANVTGHETSEAGRKNGSGRGLFETVGWELGMSGVRDITVTRTTGPAGSKVFRLRWKGNVGAFSSSLKEVNLPLNQPVKIPVAIKVGDTGSYSAILDLIDPEVDLIAHSVLATIFVPKSLSKVNGNKVTITNTLDRPGNSVALVNVPPGLSALQVRMKRADGIDDLPKNGMDNWQFIVEDPLGRRLPYSHWRSSVNEGRESASVKGEQIQIYPNPVPGVWQFFFEVRFPVVPPTDPKLKSTEVTWNFTGYSVASKSDSSSGTVSFSNESSSALKAKITPLGLGSERESSIAIKPGLEATLVEVNVPAGSKRLEIGLGSPDPNSVVGFYVYRRPDDPGKSIDNLGGNEYNPAMVYYDNSGVTSKHWAIDSPKPGKYVVAIDPLRVPATGLTVRYRDLIVNPAYGELNCSDDETLMAPGAEKSVKVDWKVGAIPTAERRLVAVAALIGSELGYSKLSGTRWTPSAKLELVPVILATHSVKIQTSQSSLR
jgi:hypothetical protein